MREKFILRWRDGWKRWLAGSGDEFPQREKVIKRENEKDIR